MTDRPFRFQNDDVPMINQDFPYWESSGSMGNLNEMMA